MAESINIKWLSWLSNPSINKIICYSDGLIDLCAPLENHEGKGGQGPVWPKGSSASVGQSDLYYGITAEIG